MAQYGDRLEEMFTSHATVLRLRDRHLWKWLCGVLRHRVLYGGASGNSRRFDASLHHWNLGGPLPLVVVSLYTVGSGGTRKSSYL